VNIPIANLSIHFDHRSFEDTDRIRAKKYEVDIFDMTRQFTIELVPESDAACGWRSRHVRQVDVDLAEAKLVSDLPHYLSLHEHVGSITIPYHGISPFQAAQPLCSVPEHQMIIIRYHSKPARRYQFASIDHSEFCVSVPADSQ
jgi:hypothetical protein